QHSIQGRDLLGEGRLGARDRMLAMRAVQALGGRAQGATLYIPPLDTRRFVGAVAELRSMQSAFASEYARRAEQADSTGIEFDTFSPMVLNGVEYRDLQQAEDALHRYREGLLAGPAMRFAQGMSQNFAAELMPLLSGSDVLVNDLGSTKWSDTALIEGELALGGLARSLVARSTLRDDGIDYVLAPRIDTLGSAYQLRLDIYDLGRGAVLATTYVLVDEAFSAELEGELGAQTGLEPIELPKVGARLETPGAWTAVYDEAVDGVVLIVDLESGRGGTGFVVDSSGLVMTNSHVVEGMSDQTIALWRDGTERSLELLVRDVDQDLAVLRLDSPAAGMHVFELADPTEAAVGLEVAVIGHPKDARESGWSSSGWVMSPGYLSSVSERVTMPSGRERLSYMYTCPTRKGNSGSPVLSRAGRVVAVNSHGTAGDLYAAGGELADAADSGAILTELPGFSKGAPANEARRVLEEARLLR
ncbi:MAG: serine protease, partial [Planctomycetota bacterium]